VGLRPRVGLERVVGRQVTWWEVERGWKVGRPGRRRWVRDLWTRLWAAWGEEARTRQMIWGEEGWLRRRERRCAPRAPVAPVRICGWLLSGGRKEEGRNRGREVKEESVESRKGQTYDDFAGAEGAMAVGSSVLIQGAVVVCERGFEVVEGAVLLHKVLHQLDFIFLFDGFAVADVDDILCDSTPDVSSGRSSLLPGNLRLDGAAVVDHIER